MINLNEKKKRPSVLKVLGVILLVLGSLVVCFMCFAVEYDSARKIYTLEAGENSVISIPSDRIDPLNDSRLVHLTAFADTDVTCTDDVFGVTEPKAIKLVRIVEMYQWKETKSSHTTGNGHRSTTYYHKKVWSQDVINSNKFSRKSGHQNPNKMKYQTVTVTALNVAMGPFKLGRDIIEELNFFNTRYMKQEDYDKLPKNLKKEFKLMSGMFYMGNSAGNPMIGDMKVSFHIVKPMIISVVAKQSNDMLQTYDSETGPIALAVSGNVLPEEMFRKAEKSESLNTWLARVPLYFFLMGLFAGIAAINEEFFKKLPVIGIIVNKSFVAFIFVIPLVFCFILAAFGNLMFNLPKAAALYGAAVLLFGLVFLWAKKRPNRMR